MSNPAMYPSILHRKMRLLVLFSILAAACGFGAVPHAEPAEEYPCRNKETPVFVAHAELIADCVA